MKKECLKRTLEELKTGRNVLIWKQNVFNYTREVEKRYCTIFLNELSPVKSKLIQLIIAVQLHRQRKVPSESELERMTVDHLKNMLLKKVGMKVVIAFNHFERLSPSTARFWLQISGHEKVVFLGSLYGKFKKDAYGFYKTFKVINKEVMESEGPGSEIDITLPFILLVGAFFFISYLKISTTQTATMIGAVWFAFLVIRSLMYLVR